jgi:phosphoserine phosphatase
MSFHQQLLQVREAILHTHPLDRIPRDQINQKIKERLCYEQKLNRLCASHKRTGDVILIKRGQF